ncbi:aminoacyl-histidine dipeptidase [Pasteurella atlantica]|uniref:aminoacyl-histidine dipeptidase n=1 Tax=Pasteurellaceae TaxID=712 RepID=UPI002774F667|nr:aminoacyl-histidine dipeptidase [Pasteurella atlantica]MDP8032932.1 aminoacyl-histidine dipeptidase [Pasteurella atlantica]MDP8034911.1 aminoacyl-histidine dipeptidase [Pasteurella atlantica]MDP8036819.1 aminoacyl-histidine dipeptidase [Pasteurella atlantica]MDP8047208.1 aminoacyl-histidine dipeptidase [Pasteurella atlantica]MDP8049282.1 aminoacyl-histidine dipeptidase [Pasteurella atlantica]
MSYSFQPTEISTLSPTLLWQWFDKICAIPHPSYYEEQLACFIVDWAKSQSLFVERDEVGNILIRKPATRGMENRQTVTIQAHLDMVPQANDGIEHNFVTDPIQPYINGEWVTAKETTLGADNGIGMASCLALLESNDIEHPVLEVLLTVEEETSMKGAMMLRPNWLQGDILINTDTEDNGEIYIGCAQGTNVSFDMPIEREKNQFDDAIQITIKGLLGGHSGFDIHKGRVSAIKLMARVLMELKQEVEFQLIDIKGGTVHNAIPREAVTSITFFAKNSQNVTACIQQIEKNLQKALSITEPHLTFLIEKIEPADDIFTKNTTHKVINTLNILPDGLIRKSDRFENVTETSLSTGVLKTEQNHLSAIILIRSLFEEGKNEVKGKLQSLAELTESNLNYFGDYAGWTPDLNSKITQITKQVYDELLGYETKIKVVHAGFECGFLKQVYPNLDMVSIGPTIRHPHSPDEKVHIPAVAIYWELLIRLLKNIPLK